MPAKQPVQTSDAFDSASPYSQGIKHGDTLYVAGQVPVTPDGTLVEGDIGAQTEQVLQNIEAILQAAGASMDDLVKTTVFLTDIETFEDFNEVYAEYVPEPRPARSAVEIADLAIDAGVEIEAMAVL